MKIFEGHSAKLIEALCGGKSMDLTRYLAQSRPSPKSQSLLEELLGLGSIAGLTSEPSGLEAPLEDVGVKVFRREIQLVSSGNRSEGHRRKKPAETRDVGLKSLGR
jgi:hypothetical protein